MTGESGSGNKLVLLEVTKEGEEVLRVVLEPRLVKGIRMHQVVWNVIDEIVRKIHFGDE